MSESIIRRTLEIHPNLLLLFEKAVSKGFEGTLSDYINEKMTKFYEEQTTEWPCAFRKQPCPVKKQYKLKPESLVLFCNVCPTKSKTDFSIEKLAVETIMKLLEIEKHEKSELNKKLYELIRKGE